MTQGSSSRCPSGPFEAAVAILNGEWKPPAPPRPKLVWRPTVPNAEAKLKARIEQLVQELKSSGLLHAAEELRLGLPGPSTAEDLNLLCSGIAVSLKRQAQARWKSATSPRFLPKATERWDAMLGRGAPPRYAAAYVRALRPLWPVLLLAQTRASADALVSVFNAEPVDTIAATRDRLVLAEWFTLCQLTKQRLVLCAACGRAFVARTAKAIHCSETCRQRYSRYTRNDWQKAAEKDRLRKERTRHLPKSKPPARKG